MTATRKRRARKTSARTKTMSDEGEPAVYVVNIVCERLNDRGENTVEEARMHKYSTKALQKCPACGWLNYTVEDWNDDPLVCENPACGRVRSAAEEAFGEGSALYVYCEACARWYDADLFPRHLMTKHLQLPGDGPYNIIPGQEGK
jgi:hypothetical protein